MSPSDIARLIAFFVAVVLVGALIQPAHGGEPGHVFSDPVKGNHVELLATPCADGTDAQAAGILKDWRRATLTYKGERFLACWRNLQGAPGVQFMDSAGDQWLLPDAAFKDAKRI